MTTTRSITSTAIALLIASTSAISAQSADSAAIAPTRRWEVLGSSGALLPTGAQRSALKRAPMSTAQVLYVINPRVAITSTLGWGRGRDLAVAGAPRLSVFTYDVGIEARAPRWRQASMFSVVPFAGVGAGGRSYDHRGRDVDARHNLAGYASLGGEMGAGRVRLRIEGRNYLSRFTPLVGSGPTATRQDFTLLAGLRLTRKPASE